MIGIEVRGLELKGAYGRPTRMEDWRSGKDFKIVGGPYCSNRDIEEIKKEGFQILEFTQGGALIERIILDERIRHLIDIGVRGEFERVEE